MIVMLAGCANQEDAQDINTVENQETTQEENAEVQSEQANEEEQPVAVDDNELVETSIYVVDMNTGEIVQKQVESTRIDEQFLWEQLREANIVPSEGRLLSVLETQEGVVLDVDSNFGDYLRSMGTAGEIEILNCVAWTYMDVFGVEKVKITEEGDVLVTGHGEVSDYIGKDN